jgi:hypothetical protein
VASPHLTDGQDDLQAEVLPELVENTHDPRTLAGSGAYNERVVDKVAGGGKPSRPLRAVGVGRPEPGDPDGEHHQGAAP